MNFMMNNQQSKPGKTIITFHQSSSILDHHQGVNYMISRTPLLFNLYENRLVHSEFLKEVFTELLENKEILAINFQTKIISLYSPNNKFYIFKISLLKRSKIILVSGLIILLLKSFPYKFVFEDNKQFFQLHVSTILKIVKSPLALSLLIGCNLLRKLKIQNYIIRKKIQRIFFNVSRGLSLRYCQYRNFSQNINLSSQDYRNLFTNLQFLQLVRIYNSFTLFWICLVFREHFLVKRLVNKFNSKLIS